MPMTLTSRWRFPPMTYLMFSSYFELLSEFVFQFYNIEMLNSIEVVKLLATWSSGIIEGSVFTRDKMYLMLLAPSFARADCYSFFLFCEYISLKECLWFGVQIWNSKKMQKSLQELSYNCYHTSCAHIRM